MRELYDLKTSEVIDNIIKEVREHDPAISSKDAKKLILNALIYNCVIEEIIGQVDFLMGKDPAEQ